MQEVNFSRSIDLPETRKSHAARPKRERIQRPNMPRVKTLDEVKEQVSNAIKNVGGRYVKFDDIDHNEGLLIAGIISDDEKKTADSVKFAIMNRDRKVVYVHYNEHFSVLKDIPSSLFVLNYLYQREPETLMAIAEDTFEDNGDEVITKICIHIPERKPDDKKGKGKNKKQGKNKGNRKKD